MQRIKMARLLPILLAMFISACVTAGKHDTDALHSLDFGPVETLRVCLLVDEGITEQSARTLFEKMSDELSIFDLEVEIPWVRPWKRPAFLMNGIIEEVALRPLEAPCDRLMAVVGRHVGDFLISWFAPEILGAVETNTHTRGYVVGKSVTFNQLLQRPSDVAVHESYHLLGCIHGRSLRECYPYILELKRMARASREGGNDFFPGISLDRKPITSREATDEIIRAAVGRSE
ncbi:hypothetical protein BOX17_14595 [Halomonas aestuarii]|uniref:Uncharacterized protein n=1 Tax=Halomonas aestuarii TaxID=1897729 RepID=A0A1J0VJ82_9GAMM|nr:hypothetical protein [Halomonas aestuarii]APE32073.1 hypothetical protein BOX17_14595 [Halomonas aestuarii]